MDYTQIQAQISQEVSAIRREHDVQYGELKEKHKRERSELEQQQGIERMALNQKHMDLWEQYREIKSGGMTRVIAHNSAVKDYAHVSKLEKLAQKVREKHVLVSTTVDDIIDELEERIEKNLRIAYGAGKGGEGDTLLTGVQKMRKSIIALGGTPKPDPARFVVHDEQASSAGISDEQMESELRTANNPPPAE